MKRAVVLRASSPGGSSTCRVDDDGGTAERAAALGGTVVMAPTDTPGFRSAVIADPQGAVISISAPVTEFSPTLP